MAGGRPVAGGDMSGATIGEGEAQSKGGSGCANQDCEPHLLGKESQRRGLFGLRDS